MKKNGVALLALALLLSSPVPAQGASDEMEGLLAQGASAYEDRNYSEALDHFSAALLHAAVNGESPLYAASYLCAYWYKGRGIQASAPRARNACTIARGGMERFQLDLFRQVLEQEGEGGLRIDRDAAEALQWFLAQEPDETPLEEFPEPQD